MANSDEKKGSADISDLKARLGLRTPATAPLTPPTIPVTNQPPTPIAATTPFSPQSTELFDITDGAEVFPAKSRIFWVKIAGACTLSLLLGILISGTYFLRAPATQVKSDLNLIFKEIQLTQKSLQESHDHFQAIANSFQQLGKMVQAPDTIEKSKAEIERIATELEKHTGPLQIPILPPIKRVFRVNFTQVDSYDLASKMARYELGFEDIESSRQKAVVGSIPQDLRGLLTPVASDDKATVEAAKKSGSPKIDFSGILPDLQKAALLASPARIKLYEDLIKQGEEVLAQLKPRL